MPKEKTEDPLSQMNIKLRGSLVRKVRILLLDPKTGKVKYGALAKLVTQLLNDWVESKLKVPTNG